MGVKTAKESDGRDDGAEEPHKQVEEVPEAPDGGWGWMVVLGSALSNVVIIPVMQCFTLLFKDRFTELEFNSTDITALVSLNSSFGMIMGIFNGPLLKKFGYRKLAFTGVTLFTAGVFATAMADSYVHFIISYGLLTSLGMTVTMASFSLAMNSYFKKKRSNASGWSMTLTGLGPVIMPLVISELLSSYGTKWATIIIAGINMHSYLGVMMLRPIKWYMKFPKKDEEKQTQENVQNEEAFIQCHDSNSMFGFDASLTSSRRTSLVPLKIGRSISAVNSPSMGSLPQIKSAISQELLRNNLDWMESNINYDKNRARSVTRLDNDDYGDMMKSTLYILERPGAKNKAPEYASAETLSSMGDKNLSWRKIPNGTEKPLLNNHDTDDEDEVGEKQVEKKKKTGFWRGIWNMYDIDLLYDPIYINIMLGMSIAVNGEFTFSIMTPLILKDIGLSTERIAVFMSVTAVTDLVCRFISPYVGRCLKLSSRAMYMIALFLLLLTRGSLYLANSYYGLLAVAAGLGIGKGFRTVFWVIVIPDYVPLSKLPSASAFQSLINGILILLSGPIIGLIVGINNNYMNLVLVSNVLTLTTIIMWSLEMLIVRCRSTKKLDRRKGKDGQ